MTDQEIISDAINDHNSRNWGLAEWLVYSYMRKMENPYRLRDAFLVERDQSGDPSDSPISKWNHWNDSVDFANNFLNQ